MNLRYNYQKLIKEGSLIKSLNKDFKSYNYIMNTSGKNNSRCNCQEHLYG